VIELEGHAELLPSRVAQRYGNRGTVRPTLHCICVTKRHSKISNFFFYARLALQQVYAVKNDVVNIDIFLIVFIILGILFVLIVVLS
jgi:hypothetical protein